MAKIRISTKDIEQEQIIKGGLPGLCKALGIAKSHYMKDGKSIKGTSRMALEKEIKRYIRYEKSGQSYTIKEIYEDPLPSFEFDKREDGLYTKHARMLLALILLASPSEMVEQHEDYRQYNLTVTNWLKALYFCSHKYKTTSAWNELIEHYTEDELYSFYEDKDRKMKGSLFSVLNSLRRQSLLKYEEEVMIVNTNNIQRMATKQEKASIMKAERDELDELGYKDKWSVSRSKDKNKFYQNVVSRLKNDAWAEQNFNEQMENMRESCSEEQQEIMDSIVYERKYPGKFTNLDHTYKVVNIIFSESSLNKHLDRLVQEFCDELQLYAKLEDDMKQINTINVDKFIEQINKKYRPYKIATQKKQDEREIEKLKQCNLVNELIFIDAPELPNKYKAFLAQKSSPFQ